jgi:hypothetical protein
MEASDKDYICSLEKDNGMHRCADLPPTKFDSIECQATLFDFLNYSHSLGDRFVWPSTTTSTPSPFVPLDLLALDQADNVSIRHSVDNFNMIFPLPGTNRTDCINWNLYYSKCQAGLKNPFQGM